MARIQQSIEIRVPVHVAYNQLTQFEDYPQFMEEVQAVEQVDEAHLHWTTIMSNRPVEWDAQIVEQQADRCIAWHNISGPTNAGRVDVEPLGDDASRVTLTLDAEPQQVPGSASGDSAQDMEQRLRMDLARLKDFIEQRGNETGAWRGEIHDGQVTLRDRDARGDQQQAGGMAGMPGQESGSVADLGVERGTGRSGDTAGRQTDQVAALGADQGRNGGMQQSTQQQAPHTSGASSGDLQSTAQTGENNATYGAGSEGMSGDEDFTSPVISSGQMAQQRDAGQSGTQQEGTADMPGRPQTLETTQSDYSLSQADPDNDDGRFSVAEEVNFDQQSNALRHVGQMPQDTSIGEAAGASDAVGKAMSQGDRGANIEPDQDKLKQALKDKLPPPQ